MIIKTAALIGTLSFFCSCATPVEFIRKEMQPTKQAVLRYPSTSQPEKNTKSYNEAKKKAHDFCAGDFSVTKEYQSRQPTGASSGIGTGLGIGMGGIMVGASRDTSAMYNVLEVTCKNESSSTTVK